MLDEVPVAFVVPRDGAPPDLAKRVIDHCRMHLADFKVVREVHLLDHLPKGLLDKVAKNELRAKLAPLVASSDGVAERSRHNVGASE
jgi:acyl-coenzyme A synthetase/AMP-(fatty) acid ligase